MEGASGRANIPYPTKQIIENDQHADVPPLE
jgi:hypothetical protein